MPHLIQNYRNQEIHNISIKKICLIEQEHTGRVFRLQFDEFQIVSSSHDDTILIWDFLNYTPPERNESRRSPSRELLLAISHTKLPCIHSNEIYFILFFAFQPH